MKKTFLSLTFLLFVLSLFGQNDQPTYGYSYQAIIRDAAGNPLVPNQIVLLRARILNASDDIQYEETHVATIDQFGKVTVVIGAGVASAGNFNTLNWAGQKHFLNVGVKLNGAANFADLGKEEIVLQPFAGKNGEWINISDSILYTSERVGIGGPNNAPSDVMLQVKNPGKPTNLLIGDYSATGKTFLGISTTADENGFGKIQVVKKGGSAWGDILLNPKGGSVGINTGDVAPTGDLCVRGNLVLMHPDDANISGGNVLRFDYIPSSAPFTGAGGFRMVAMYPYGGGWSSGPRAVALGYNGDTWFATDENGSPLGNVGIGTNNPQVKLDVNGDARIKTLTLLGNDRAHLLNTTTGNALPIHTVAVFDEKQLGKIRPCASAYDRKVAGVVSDTSPTAKHRVGILHAQENTTNGSPIAIDGTVEVLVVGPVGVGDFLTTSEVEGYAMRATNRRKAYGAILGKAMSPMAKGEKGVVEMWVERH